MKITNTKQLFEVFNNRKKITRLAYSYESFEKWINTINAINGLEEEVTCFNGELLTSFKIPTILKDLILPEKVSLIDGRNSSDLREKIEMKDDEKVLTAHAFTEVSILILGSMKMDTGAVSSIERSSDTLNNVIARTVEEGHVNKDICVPIELGVGPFMKTHYYSVPATDALRDWCKEVLTKQNTKQAIIGGIQI